MQMGISPSAVKGDHMVQVFFLSGLYRNAQGLLDTNATAINIDTGVWRYITGCSQLVAANGAYPYQGRVVVTVQVSLLCILCLNHMHQYIQRSTAPYWSLAARTFLVEGSFQHRLATCELHDKKDEHS